MIPIGILPKIISKEPHTDIVKEICSLSTCISKTPNKYIDDWKHNDFDLFNTEELAIESVKNKKTKFDLFYYELYEKEFYNGIWSDIEFKKLTIIKKDDYKFIGYDISCFSNRRSPDCSPLSCNYAGRKYNVNEYCLINDLNEATKVIEDIERNKDAEEGPYRIISVNRKIKRN